MLERVGSGDPNAARELLPLVYEELRRLAASKMAQETPGQTLQATALVHEAWLRIGGDQQRWENRAHFFAAAAEAMRRILIDVARSKAAVRHGGSQRRMELTDDLPASDNPELFLRLNELIEELAVADPVKAQVVKLRYFVGLDNGEVARMLGVSEKTVQRAWTFARAWLYSALSA